MFSEFRKRGSWSEYDRSGPVQSANQMEMSVWDREVVLENTCQLVTSAKGRCR
jgi:hypothetical protein